MLCMKERQAVSAVSLLEVFFLDGCSQTGSGRPCTALVYTVLAKYRLFLFISGVHAKHDYDSFLGCLALARSVLDKPSSQCATQLGRSCLRSASANGAVSTYTALQSCGPRFPCFGGMETAVSPEYVPCMGLLHHQLLINACPCPSMILLQACTGLVDKATGSSVSG